MSIVAGVLCVRNEIDIVEANIKYHLDQGIDKIYVVDNGSTDGTGELVNDIFTNDPRVIISSEPGEYRPNAFMAQIASSTDADRIGWWISLDADEFWSLKNGREVINALDGYGEIQVRVDNYVQSRHYDAENWLKTVMYRIPDENYGEIVHWMNGECSYVQIRWSAKKIFRNFSGIEIGMGGHTTTRVVGQPFLDDIGIVARHIPLRSKKAIAKKKELGKRLIDAGWDRGSGTESQHWYLEDLSESEAWTENSQVDGILGNGVQLVPDDSVSRIV